MDCFLSPETVFSPLENVVSYGRKQRFRVLVELSSFFAVDAEAEAVEGYHDITE